MKKFFVILLVSFFAQHIFAQEQTASKYELRGVFRDQNSAVIPGLRLLINGEHNSLTDINGEFKILLSDGDYLLTATLLAPDKFRAFIKVNDTGLNPNFLEFIVDSEAIVCSGNRGAQSPKMISSVEPIYPPVAKAVRAGGEVTVVVKINQDGKVSSAKAISGHPLLRRASEVAAAKFVFESVGGIVERETAITFVFMPDEGIKKGLNRYKCSYRVIIVGELVVIETRETR